MQFKSHKTIEEISRMNAMIFRRLQSAGAQGLMVGELAPMIREEFGGSLDYCRNVLIHLAQSAKIFRKICPMPTGGIGGRYFLTAEWCDGYTTHLPPKKKRSMSERVEAERFIPEVLTVPKYGVTEREPMPHEFGQGIIIPEGVRVQVCDPYKSDYRLAVDPANIPRHVDSSQCREWAKA